MWGQGAVVLLAGVLLTACATVVQPGASGRDDHVKVVDETGWLTSSEDPWSGTFPLDSGTDTLLFNPDGDQRTLVVTWLSGVCVHDRTITLTNQGDLLSVVLDMGKPDELPEGAGCPAMGIQYVVGLHFDRIVARADAELSVRTWQ